jgi:uncharacterized peroxidase-related enzyme
MSRLPLINPDTATGEANELLTAVKEKLGVVPNMTKAMANSPQLLSAYLSIAGALAKGSINSAVGEQIALVVAQSNGCSYCLSVHTYVGEKIAHLSPEEIHAARRAESSNAHTQALLVLAKEINEGRGEISDEAVRTARAAGVSDAEFADVLGHVALNVLTNYVNKAAQVDIDWPVVTP